MSQGIQPAYDIREASERIANGHAYKHVDPQDRFSARDNGKYGPQLDINSPTELEGRSRFANHIEQTMRDPETKVFRGVNEKSGLQTRDIYHNENTNTTVVVNQNDPDGGTCYRDALNKEPSLDRLLRQDNDNRQVLGLALADPPQKGGYEALYPQNEQSAALHQQPESPEPTKPGGKQALPEAPAPEPAVGSASAVDLTKVDLPKYAAAEHGYTIEKTHSAGNFFLDKGGERLEVSRAKDGSWSYENQKNTRDANGNRDQGTIVDFAARRGAGSPQAAETAITDYLRRNPDEQKKALESTAAAQNTPQQMATRSSTGRDE